MPTADAQSFATTLPARYYTDPDLFRDELERFYCQTWICAGRANQIPAPGDYFLREIAGAGFEPDDLEAREGMALCRDRDLNRQGRWQQVVLFLFGIGDFGARV